MAIWIAPPLIALGLLWFFTRKSGDKEEENEIIGGIEMGGTNIKLCLAKTSSNSF